MSDSIMERAPEIMEAMDCFGKCKDTSCGECKMPIRNGIRMCADWEDVYKESAELIRALQSELERVKRERDAAIADLKHKNNCDICKHEKEEPVGCDLECLGCKREDCHCNTCENESNWEWRGVEAER